jgi:hypothetical protein
MGHLFYVLLIGHTNTTFVVHNRIDREHKSCDVVRVKLPYMSLFILLAVSFADGNIVPFFSFLTVCFQCTIWAAGHCEKTASYTYWGSFVSL